MARRLGTDAVRSPVRRRAGGVLVTGFEPFGGEGVNPSWEICVRLPAAIGGARAGFIHVPWLERQALTRPGEPAMALASMVRAVEAAVTAALDTAEEVKVAAGKIC